MTPFLRQIARHYRDVELLRDYCFVFPNRRSGQFFLKELAEQTTGTIMLPQVTTLNDWLASLDQRATVGAIEATFTLYDCYAAIFGDQASPIDRFVFWANIILSDFTDVDMSLANPDELFANISDLRDIATDYIDPALKSEIARIFNLDMNLQGKPGSFWKRDGLPESETIDSYFTLWERMSELYHRFHEALDKKGLVTMGHLYRDMAQRMKQTELAQMGCRRVVFMGFAALTASEDAIFKNLAQRDMADFWWDVASPAMDLPDNKGGQMVKALSERYPAPATLETLPPLKEPLTVQAVGVPSLTGQAKWAFHTIEQMATPPGQREEAMAHLPTIDPSDAFNTAIVLPDESLLEPLVNSIPQNITLMNVTMGYPMRHAAITSLMHLVAKAHSQARHDRSRDEWFFYREDVLNILSHPIVKAAYTADVLHLINTIEQNKDFNVSETLLVESKLANLFVVARDLSSKNEVTAFILRLQEFAADLNQRIITADQAAHHFDTESGDNAIPLQAAFIEHFIEALDQLLDVLDNSPHLPVEGDALFFLIDRLTSNLTVPFSGEPLAGLQVMGMLETRCLDFENLVMLSTNERVLPSRKSISSFIPDMVRAAFFMRTNQTEEAVATYHFYRLLSRARFVSLVYCTTSQAGASSEPSRFIAQLEKVYGIELDSFYADAQVTTVPELGISVEKTASMVNPYVSEHSDKRLSASSINEFIDCPLKFYFRHIQGLNADTEVTDFMDAGTFGTIIHDTLQEVYYPLMPDGTSRIAPHTVTRDSIKQFIGQRLHTTITRQVNKTYLRLPEEKLDQPLRGDAFILQDTIEAYVKAALKYDLELIDTTGCDIEVMECEIDHPITLNIDGTKVNFIFKADRVDRIGDQLRIVDYKTGKDPTKFSSIETLFDNAKIDRPHAILQLMLYCNAWQQLHPENDMSITPMIYKLRDMSETGVTTNKQQYTFSPNDETNLTFRKLLKEQLDHLLNVDEPFEQAPGDNNCTYCRFTDFCRRQGKKNS